MRALLSHSLARVRGLVAVIGILLALLQLILVLVAGAIQTSGQFAQLAALFPPFVRALMGPAMTALFSFGGVVSLGYFEPAVIFAATGLAIALGTRLALEVENGFLDLLLARAVPRHHAVTASITVAILGLGFVVSLMVAGTWLGLRTLAPVNAEKPAWGLVLSLAANLGLLGLSWSGIALAIASGLSRRGLANAITGVLALVAFLLEYIARLWEPAARWAWLSPYTYFKAFEMVNGASLPWQHVTVLGAIALGGFALAYAVFLRRDISR